MPLHYLNEKDLGMCYDGRVALLISQTANLFLGGNVDVNTDVR
jgi:hypothetical protein